MSRSLSQKGDRQFQIEDQPQVNGSIEFRQQHFPSHDKGSRRLRDDSSHYPINSGSPAAVGKFKKNKILDKNGKSGSVSDPSQGQSMNQVLDVIEKNRKVSGHANYHTIETEAYIIQVEPVNTNELS